MLLYRMAGAGSWRPVGVATVLRRNDLQAERLASSLPPCCVTPCTMRLTNPMKTNGHATAEQAIQTIQAARLPRYVVDRRCLIDLDSTGEEAIHIWLLVADKKRVTAR